jgi:hypothetical protein
MALLGRAARRYYRKAEQRDDAGLQASAHNLRVRPSIRKFRKKLDSPAPSSRKATRTKQAARKSGSGRLADYIIYEIQLRPIRIEHAIVCRIFASAIYEPCNRVLAA